MNDTKTDSKSRHKSSNCGQDTTPNHCDELTSGSLRGHLLISMPGLTDPNFSRSLTYICEHDDNGAMGIIINHPLELSIRDVFDQLELPTNSSTGQQQVLAGGPVQVEQGFVLHPTGSQWEATSAISSQISLTASRDILVDMAADQGPENSLVALGYAGWGAGQLEAEIAHNDWLSVPADSKILFHTPCEMRWSAAAKQLGVDLNLMTAQAGHA